MSATGSCELCGGDGFREVEADQGYTERCPMCALREEVRSLKVEYTAAANIARRRTEELDTLREWCRERGYLPDDLPRPKSFDRELHDRLASARAALEREKKKKSRPMSSSGGF